MGPGVGRPAGWLAPLAALLLLPAGVVAPGWSGSIPLANPSSGPCPAGSPVQLLDPAELGPTRAPARPAADPQGRDYRHRLAPTPLGWPRRHHWCVWVEPASGVGPAARWEQAWLTAVDAALASWAELVPITRTARPDQAQVRILRRRPPLRGGRASHGRAELALAVLQRGERQELEPVVQLSLSPGQRPLALQATALHELGHAFGLWGHSDQAGDAMAAVPGAVPVLQLSHRDRATFQWLQQQAGLSPAAQPGPAR